MGRKSLALLIGLILTVAISSLHDFSARCADIRDNTLRLHVLANSNSREDQTLKLYVRDALIVHTAGLTQTCTDRDEAEAQFAVCLGQIEQIARAALQERGCDDPVRVEITNMFFPTRMYESATLPAGRYDAVRVTLGAGAGQNWWCVMFPPMCLPAAMDHGDSALEEQIRMLSEAPCYEIKFAVVELYETIRDSLRS